MSKKTTSMLQVITILMLTIVSFSVNAAEIKSRYAAINQWRDLKFGLFIHWGLYSIPGGEWDGKKVTLGYSEQIQAHGKIPKADYVALAKGFNPTAYNPEEIAKLAKAAGMKYVIMTTKHHDGFNMFHTKHSKYNVVDATPHKKDTLKQLEDACRKYGLGVGIYFSLIDWNYPGALPISSHNSDKIPAAHEEFNVKQIEELMTNYGEIVEVWFDMSNPTLKQSKRFADVVHDNQPNALVNGRIWNNQGDFLVMGDNKVPKYKMRQPWQTPASIYSATWGYRKWQKREHLEEKTIEHIQSLVNVVGRGGNYLLNIGPKGDGSLVKFEADLLKGIGKWMRVNQESIYGTTMNPFDSELSFGQVTVKKQKMYLHVIKRPEDGKLNLPGLKNKINKVYRLDDDEKRSLRMRHNDEGLMVELPIKKSKNVLLDAVQVVVVEFEGELDIERSNVTTVEAKGQATLNGKDAVDYFSRSGGDYYSTKRTTVEKSWAFKVSQSGQYQISITGEAGDIETAYSIKLGKTSAVFNFNKKENETITVVVIKCEAGQVYDMSLLLHNPIVKEQNLDITNVVITIKKI